MIEAPPVSAASTPGARRTVVVRTAIAVAGMAAYAWAVWLGPVTQARASGPGPALTGAQVRAWRGASCQTCHSVFGLGGHLGPDLTTVTARRPEGFVDAMLRSPPAGMPSFSHLSDAERADIVGYLRAVEHASRQASATWFTRGERPR